MDVAKILDEMRAEHAALTEVIISLERLAAGGKRRGRPPAWVKAAKPPLVLSSDGRADTTATPNTRTRKKRTARRKS